LESILDSKGDAFFFLDMSSLLTSVSFRVIPDVNPNLVAAEKVRKVVFCSGKVYYDLASFRDKNNINDVAIVRVEQLGTLYAYRFS